jgi:hypothetical protein
LRPNHEIKHSKGNTGLPLSVRAPVGERGSFSDPFWSALLEKGPRTFRLVVGGTSKAKK